MGADQIGQKGFVNYIIFVQTLIGIKESTKITTQVLKIPDVYHALAPNDIN